MTPSSSAFPALQPKEDDHHHQHFQLLFSTTAPSSYHASSSHPSPAFFYTSTNQPLKGGYHSPRPQQHHEYHNKGDKCIFSHGGYGERQVLSSSSSSSSLLQPMVDESYKSSHELSVLKKEEGDEGDKISSTDEKWMSSKMRLMRKMMNSGCTAAKTDRKVEDHQQQQPGNSVIDYEINISTSTVPIRVCSDCNTTKTPLWRSGPRGPKSLCNACGIRQRKARRAAAAAAVTGIERPQSSPLKVKLPANKEKKAHTGNAGQQKKVCKPRQCPPPTKKKSCFEDISSSLSKNASGFRRVFPQDEEEAAFLLMALSCDLVYT